MKIAKTADDTFFGLVVHMNFKAGIFFAKFIKSDTDLIFVASCCRFHFQ